MELLCLLVRSSYLLSLDLVVVSIAVREWLAGADCMWEKLVELWSKSSLEWALCSIILLIKGR